MSILLDGELYDDLLRFDPETGDAEKLSRIELEKRTKVETKGNYAILNGVFLAFYVHKGEILLRIDDQVFPFDDEIQVHTRELEKENWLLQINRQHQRILDLPYYCKDQMFPSDLTPFVEEEHFNFGLFLQNISQSPSRKRILIEGPDCDI